MAVLMLLPQGHRHESRSDHLSECYWPKDKKKRGFEGGRSERKDIQENGDNCNKMQCFYYSDLRAQTNAERQ